MSCSQIGFPKAVLFDMDGTLTAPTFDFPGLRIKLGLPPGSPILEGVAALNPSRRSQALAILHQYEDEMAATAPLADGCEELLQHLLARGTSLAVITRNRRESVATFVRRHPLPIGVWITREDGPHKPDPAPLLTACLRLGIDPKTAWMVGDGQFDVEAGINAGMPSIWLSHGRKREFAAEPWKTVEALRALLRLCKTIG